MPYNIALCDDSPADIDFVSSLVRLWALSRSHQVHIASFPSAESFLFALGDCPWDILLLDIEMGKMDGVTMARQLRRVNDAIQIIFITGYSDYIAEGYEVAALHYLLKPVGEEKLLAVLDRAAEALRRNERCLTLKLSEEIVRVPLRQIKYVDVSSNYVTVHAKSEYTLKRSLKDIADALDESFYRLGRSAIVNLRFIARVTKADVVLTDGSVLPLPRGSYEGINRAIIGLDNS